MSIKMFYIRIMGQEWPDRQLGFSKVTNKLPVVLTQDEVGRVLDQMTNLKHKAIICLIYSAGLRVSELLDLKTPFGRGFASVEYMLRGSASITNTNRNPHLSRGQWLVCLQALQSNESFSNQQDGPLSLLDRWLSFVH